MELRNGKHLTPAPSNHKYLPPAPPKRVNRRKPRPFCLLDLPTELRLMIYGYAFGHENIHWTMTYGIKPIPGYVLVLGHGEGSNNIRHNINLHQRRPSLLRTCRHVLQEASPIYHNQTRFDIDFCQAVVFHDDDSAYQLQLTHGRGETSSGLARVVLRRVKHVHFNFKNGSTGYSYMWRMHLLSTFFSHGTWLKSLRFTEHGDTNPADGITWYSDYNISDFASYRGDAVLVLRNAYPTEDITELEEVLSRTYCSCFLYLFSTRC